MTTQRKTPAGVLASAIVAVFVVALCLGGAYLTGSWVPTVDSGADGSAGGQSSGQFASDVATHELVDAAGRTVEAPEEPQRIAAMDSFAGDVCVLSGAGERLFGAPGGVKSNELLVRIAPNLADVERLSGSTVNVEALLAGGVDLVFVKESMLASSGETAKLDRAGIPYIAVGYDTVDEQIEAIQLVGAACGGEAARKALSLARYYRETADEVERRSAQVADEERVSVYHSINESLRCDGAGSLGSDWITRTGAIDVSAREEATGLSGDYDASVEQVYAWDPDFVVCNSAAARDEFDSDARWSGLAVVADGRVRNLPVSASRWGQRGDPETFLAMLWLGKELYPELYADIDLKETVIAYYRDVIGLEIDDATWEEVLSGEGIRAQGTGDGGGSGGK